MIRHLEGICEIQIEKNGLSRVNNRLNKSQPLGQKEFNQEFHKVETQKVEDILLENGVNSSDHGGILLSLLSNMKNNIDFKLTDDEKHQFAKPLFYKDKKIDYKNFEQLKKTQKFKVLETICEENHIRQSTFMNLKDEEINQFFFSQSTIKIKMAICVTGYNENRQEVEKTEAAIERNIEHFRKLGIDPREIATVFIIDGIDKLCNDPNQEKNMMKQLEWIEQHIIKRDDPESNANRMAIKKQEYQMMLDLSKKTMPQLDMMRKKQDLKLFNDYPKLEKQFEDYYKKLTEEREQQHKQQSEAGDQSEIEEQESLIVEKDLQENERRFEFLKKVILNSKNYISNHDSTATLYSYLKQIFDQNKGNDDFESQEVSSSFTNVFFCVRHKNQGKLHSHAWFFQGFCQLLNPDYITLIDVGLEPDPNALSQFYRAFESDEKIGGVCGFMALSQQRTTDQGGNSTDGFDVLQQQMDSISAFMANFFDIQRAQLFEYQFAHILDQSFESILGFIHVLPGAFSAYRYAALQNYNLLEELLKQNDKHSQSISNTDLNATNAPLQLNNEGNNLSIKEDSILDFYLKPVYNPDHKNTLEEENMYLAEDRIMCLKIFAHINRSYTLRYIMTATATVDPITNLANMLGQRRRWINGSWFALVYVLKNQDEVCLSNHQAFTLVKFYFSMHYAHLYKWITYFSIGTYFIFLYMLLTDWFGDFVAKNDTSGRFSAASPKSVVLFLYLSLIGTLIFLSLNYTNRADVSVKYFYLSSTLLGLIVFSSYILMGITIYDFAVNQNQDAMKATLPFEGIGFSIIRYSLFISFGAMIPPILFNLKRIPRLVMNLIPYVYYSPTYLHLFLIYAFCRIDDFSWGTKALDKADVVHGQNQGKLKKYQFVAAWVCSNVLYGAVLSALVDIPAVKGYFILFLSILGTYLVLVRSIGSIFYYIDFFCFFRSKMNQKCPYKLNDDDLFKEQTQKIDDYFNSQKYQTLIQN